MVSPVTSVSPNIWPAGVWTDITITGSCFHSTPGEEGAEAWLEVTSFSGSGTVDIYNRDYVSTTQMTASVVPAANDTIQTACVSASWSYVDVVRAQVNATLANPALGSACTAPDGSTGVIVQIGTCPVPTITSISPNVWFTGQSYPLTITGTGFITPAMSTRQAALSAR
jgi:hypothetical protein